MRSGTGFVDDLQQGRADRAGYRRLFQTEVGCPTLVTASRADAGVAFRHAEDFVDTIPDATLAELDAPSHLFWIGPARRQVTRAIATSWRPPEGADRRPFNPQRDARPGGRPC